MSEARLVLFLGAGFSRSAALPLMGEFGPRARSTQPGLALHAQEPPESPEHRLAAGPLHRAGLAYEAFRDICVASDALDRHEWDNVERVFGIAEALRNAGEAPPTHRDIPRSGDELIDQITRWIWKTYHQLPIKRDEAQRDPDLPVERQHYKDLFGQIQALGLADRTTIVTTNYDIIPEYSAFLWGEPLRYPSPWKPLPVTGGDESFVAAPRSASGTVICKLHGSINFFSPPEDGVLRIAADLGDGAHIGKSPGSEWKDEPAICAMDALEVLSSGAESIVSPEIVPPGFSKTREARWHQTVWREARTALASATEILFIGYSLPPSDTYMEALLLSARMFSGRADQRVWVVDPSPSPRYPAIYSSVNLRGETFGEGMKSTIPEVLQRVASSDRSSRSN